MIRFHTTPIHLLKKKARPCLSHLAAMHQIDHKIIMVYLISVLFQLQTHNLEQVFMKIRIIVCHTQIYSILQIMTHIIISIIIIRNKDRHVWRLPFSEIFIEITIIIEMKGRLIHPLFLSHVIAVNSFCKSWLLRIIIHIIKMHIHRVASLLFVASKRVLKLLHQFLILLFKSWFCLKSAVKIESFCSIRLHEK